MKRLVMILIIVSPAFGFYGKWGSGEFGADYYGTGKYGETAISVPISAGDALLLESGDYLLLESGDKLLLET